MNVNDVMIQGNPAATWWSKQAGDLDFRFAAQMRKGMIAGETNDELIARVLGKSGTKGLLDVSRVQAEALVRTAVSAATNAARMSVYDKNADVIKGVQQVSTLDLRTTDICIAYDGGMWDLNGDPIGKTSLPFINADGSDEGVPRHFNCRSVLVPVTKSWEELGIDAEEMPEGKRSALDGEQPEGTTFEDWMNRLSQEEQDRILGAGRAELWREGEITLRDLVNATTGEAMNLASLQEKLGILPETGPTAAEATAAPNPYRPGSIKAKSYEFFLEHQGDAKAVIDYIVSLGATPATARGWVSHFRVYLRSQQAAPAAVSPAAPTPELPKSTTTALDFSKAKTAHDVEKLFNLRYAVEGSREKTGRTSNYPVSMSFDNYTTVEVARKIASEADDLLIHYGDMTGLTAINTRSKDKYNWGEYAPWAHTITLNSLNLNNNFQRMFDSTTVSGMPGELPYHPKSVDGIQQVVAHEFGHSVYHFIEDLGLKAYSEYADERGFGLVGPMFRQYLDSNFLAATRGGATRPVSAYARSNENEWFSETFSTMLHGTRESQDNPQVVYMQHLFNTVLNTKRWRQKFEWVNNLPKGAAREAAEEALLAEIKNLGISDSAINARLKLTP